MVKISSYEKRSDISWILVANNKDGGGVDTGAVDAPGGVGTRSILSLESADECGYSYISSLYTTYTYTYPYPSTYTYVLVLFVGSSNVCSNVVFIAVVVLIFYTYIYFTYICVLVYL